MLYCRDVPRTIEVNGFDGRKLSLQRLGDAVQSPSYVFMTASFAGPIFVIWDTEAANAVVKSFSLFGSANFGGENLLTCSTVSSGDETGVGVGINTGVCQGPDIPLLGSFKAIVGVLFQPPVFILTYPQLGRYSVSKGPTFGIVGPSPSIAQDFLKVIVDNQK